MVRRTSHEDDQRMLTRPRATAWTLYLVTLVSALPIAVIIATTNPMPEGACSGIGWGCSLYGWDLAGITLVIFGVPYAVALAIVLGLMGLLPERHGKASAVVAGIGLAIPWLFGLASIGAAS
jgi:hypothetical protein